MCVAFIDQQVFRKTCTENQDCQKKIFYDAMMPHTPKNIFDDIKLPTGEKEIFGEIINTKNVQIERIVSNGQRSPQTGWYDQEKDEWVILLDGKADIEFEDQGIFHLRKGDHLHIKAHQKHRVVYTSQHPPCIWLAIHF